MKIQKSIIQFGIALSCLLLAVLPACQNIAQKNLNDSTLRDSTPWPADSSVISRIPIETPIGKFNVWTQRFGNNPKIKVKGVVNLRPGDVATVTIPGIGTLENPVR